jgi:hypothetical protein
MRREMRATPAPIKHRIVLNQQADILMSLESPSLTISALTSSALDLASLSSSALMMLITLSWGVLSAAWPADVLLHVVARLTVGIFGGSGGSTPPIMGKGFSSDQPIIMGLKPSLARWSYISLTVYAMCRGYSRLPSAPACCDVLAVCTRLFDSKT